MVYISDSLWCLSFSDLLHFIRSSLGSSMVLQVALFHPFLWLGNTPLYMMCHIFFIHSSVDEDLGCFTALAIVHSAAPDTGVPVFF